MKLKFRKGKPPLKIMEKDELKRIATLKMKKAAKLLDTDPPAPWLPVLASEKCPLCKQPTTPENRHVVYYNRKPIAVHKKCPENK